MKTFEILENIRNERRRGSTGLAYMVLDAYRTLAFESRDIAADVSKLSYMIENLRPAMPLIARFSREIVKRLSKPTPEELLHAVEIVQNTYRKMLDELVKVAVSALTDVRCLATLSHSGSVEAVLKNHSGLRRLFVLESRPLREGLLLASSVSKHVDVEVFVDAAMAYAVEEADAVVVGADAVFADGSFSGKIGVRPLAMAAKELGKSFYVLADTWKFSEKFVNEFGPPNDVAAEHAARNPVFEKVDAKFVTWFLTEKKATEPRSIHSLITE
ncbi:MAG: hypothetical protein QXF45_05825 [Candidatus Caldarchaeum sp.]